MHLLCSLSFRCDRPLHLHLKGLRKTKADHHNRYKRTYSRPAARLGHADCRHDRDVYMGVREPEFIFDGANDAAWVVVQAVPCARGGDGGRYAFQGEEADGGVGSDEEEQGASKGREGAMMCAVWRLCAGITVCRVSMVSGC